MQSNFPKQNLYFIAENLQQKKLLDSSRIKIDYCKYCIKIMIGKDVDESLVFMRLNSWMLFTYISDKSDKKYDSIMLKCLKVYLLTSQIQ